MPEPQPIKDTCLQGGNVNAYGGREEIRRMVMATRPEEFGPVVDAYRATSELLTATITALGESAARLVADGDWGGESARAMLTRMSRLQSYLQSLRGGVNGVPPALETVSRELTTAKERFDQATEQRTYWVEASGMGAGSMEPANDPDADARAFMLELNGVYHGAHAGLPERLPWDAELASPAPYLPSPERAATPSQGGDLRFEDTVPAGLRTDLSGISGYQPAPAGPLPGSFPGSSSGSSLGGAGGTFPPQAPPAGTPAAGTPPPTSALAAGHPQPAPSGTPSAPAPSSTQPGGHPSGVLPPAGAPVGPTQNRRYGGPSTPDDPYTSAATAQDQGQPRRAETGPSVRPGSVPVVDGSWPATGPAAGRAEAGATAAGGMPFMPMGGGAPQESQTRRSVTSRSDDDFFKPDIDCGPPVVG
ncbi:hypothetical protein ITP53_47455 [Nonomuraea sp. K274]|uniref:PPE family protein n=1 Tax=Nonomuraea cypriaca TaxID=1187855 RepID=A0A931AML3_9ACTN|nr:hypothetical protein [Nonomuraea cypriaca]MBF8193184.1 hypothetical protein [Nonomuraea cypriaca]